MKRTTKQRIINQAIKHFNKNGYGAVTLYELAGILDMTRGNLTYHFKTKEELLTSIADEMWTKIKVERAKSRQFPSFENLHNEVQLYYRFQKEYAFIFLDPHVLRHPKIRQQFREITAQSIKDNEATIAFSISTGNLKPEAFAGLYHNIAFMTWMVTFFWLAQQIIRGEKTNEDGEAMIWSMLVPHLTDKGKAAFQSYFGEAYFDRLGKPFDKDNYISF